MEPDGKHALEHLGRRPDMPGPGLPGPRAPPRVFSMFSDRDGDVLVPRHLPVGQRRLVEHQGANGERRGAKIGLDEVSKGARCNGAQQGLLQDVPDASSIRASREERRQSESQLLERNRFGNPRENGVPVEAHRRLVRHGTLTKSDLDTDSNGAV